ncbi:class I glutamine amidotransferase-like protein [Xylariales sp. PMI_506]|nr:class I glutamine amidotransferase-like protein [Xylariales sp. PMI_506]
MSQPTPPTKFAVALFPGFQALDVFGPLDVLNLLSKTPLPLQQSQSQSQSQTQSILGLEFSVLAATLDPVSTALASEISAGTAIGQSVAPTHTFATAPDDVEVLLVPGGAGARDELGIAPVVEYVRRVFPRLRYLLTVCTGSVIAAKAGVLEGRRATSNKLSWKWASSHGTDVNWIAKARWVADGNIWTSSGISAGIDMMYAFIADQYGEDVAHTLSVRSEYIRNTDPDEDPFAPMIGP